MQRHAEEEAFNAGISKGEDLFNQIMAIQFQVLQRKLSNKQL